VEIFVSVVCGVAVIAACAVRRARKLRSYDAIRKISEHSIAKRRTPISDVH